MGTDEGGLLGIALLRSRGRLAGFLSTSADAWISKTE